MSDIADRIEVHPIPTIDALVIPVLIDAGKTVVELCPDDRRPMLDMLGLVSRLTPIFHPLLLLEGEEPCR